MKNNYKLSFIIPMYNSSKTIIRTLDSIYFNKECFNYEIIVIDDGSTDESVNLVSEYKQNKEKNNLIIIKKDNGGVSTARNIGIENASGEYIWFVDSDDIIEKNALYVLEEEKAFDYDIFKFNYKIEKIPKLLIVKGPKIQKDLKNSFEKDYTFNSPCTQLFNCEFLKKNKIKYHEQLSYGEDFLFNLEAYSKTKNIKITNDYLYVYKKTKSSLTRDISINRIISKLDNVKNSYGKLYDYQKVFEFEKEKIELRIKNEIISVLRSIENENDFWRVIEETNVCKELNQTREELYNDIYKKNQLKRRLKRIMRVIFK